MKGADGSAMTEQPMVCAFHPNRPTSLRCNRCGRPICTACAILTPVGYRCKVCVREQQKVFETAIWYDFLIAPVVAGVICGVGSLLGSFLGFFIIIIAAFAGSIAARAVQWAVRHRRSRYLWVAAAAGGVLGCLPVMAPTVVYLLAVPVRDLSLLAVGASLLWPAAYMVIAVAILATNVKNSRI
jgi:B-box zinc finger